MPIPKTRSELTRQVSTSYGKLRDELENAGAGAGKLHAVDDWTVKELLAVRAWWTESVIDWVEAGRKGEVPIVPAKGYSWRETPRLNAEIAKKARRESYRSIRDRLERGYQRVMRTIDALSDDELLRIGVFEWAGNYPVSRWISINTARQYATARTYLRKSLRGQ